MADANAVAGYRRALARGGQQVTFRRVDGQAPHAQVFDAVVTAIFRGYQPTTPVGTAAHAQAAITQGVREWIVLSDDLAAARFPLPVRKNDKIVVGTQIYNITDVDPGTRVFAGAIEGKAEAV